MNRLRFDTAAAIYDGVQVKVMNVSGSECLHGLDAAPAVCLYEECVLAAF
jgi:hypothetical protein